MKTAVFEYLLNKVAGLRLDTSLKRDSNTEGETFRQSLVTSYQSIITSYQLLVTGHQSLFTSYQSLVTSYYLLVTSRQLLVTSYQLILVTSSQLIMNVSSRNDICQGYSREMFSGVLCLLMLIFFRKLQRKSVSFTYLILILEFTCFSSSHEKLLYQMLFEIETDVLQTF